MNGNRVILQKAGIAQGLDCDIHGEFFAISPLGKEFLSGLPTSDFSFHRCA